MATKHAFVKQDFGTREAIEAALDMLYITPADSHIIREHVNIANVSKNQRGA